MKKRLFAILTLTFLIVSWSFSFSVHATEAVLPNSYLPGLYDISYGLSHGVYIDISKFDNAEDFISEYEYLRYKDTPIINSLSMFLDLVSDDAFGPSSYYSYDFPMSYGMSTITFNDLQGEYQEYLIDPSDPIQIGFTLGQIAFWDRYNNQYLTKYMYDLNDVDTPPSPDPDADFETIINFINDTGFIIKDYNQYYSNNNPLPHYSIFPLSLMTWVSNDNFSHWISCNMSSLYISGSNDTYSFTYVTDLVNSIQWSGDDYRNIGSRAQSGSINNGQWRLSAGSSVTPFTLSYTGTLQEVFTYISQHFRNVNIYVNGVAWALPGYISVPDFVTAPDVIFGPDGKVEGQDVFIPADPTDILSFDLTKLWELIQDAIDDPDKDVISFDDLIDGGVIIKGDGTTADDTDIDSRSLSEVIAEELSDTDSDLDDNPSGDGSIVPPLPPLIEFKPYGDSGDPTKAFDGISVLARIVNVTNKSLPDELMYVFWGIIFGMISLGLIKILHK